MITKMSFIHKHHCKIANVYDDCIEFRCFDCGLTYAVDREVLNWVLKGKWPSWLDEYGVRW